jgi:hypothetical protein
LLLFLLLFFHFYSSLFFLLSFVLFVLPHSSFHAHSYVRFSQKAREEITD